MYKILLTLLIFYLLSITCIYAQTAGSYYNPKDDKYRLLALKREKEIYESQNAEFERTKALFKDGMIPQSDYERAKSSYANAEVNYQQALLAVIFEEHHVSVVEAIKYQSADGKKHVKLKLANTSSGGGEFKKLLNIDDELPLLS